MKRRLALAFTAVLAACSPQASVETSRADARITTGLPPMKAFPPGHGGAVYRSNAQIARDFMDLTFRLESGRELDTFSRFEGRVSVRLTGQSNGQMERDLDALLARLRSEAGIDIVKVSGGDANITIEAISRSELQRLVPQAACFVSPRISSWSEFKSSRHSAISDWTTLTRREKMAIFLPGDVAPQEARDCLHEELAQALGPLNDLYRLQNSVFNDDNFNTVLTGFDMLILRATYSPELRSGMSRNEVAGRLPRVLAQLRPGGGPPVMAPPSETPRDWSQAVETALGPRTAATRRRSAAKDAVTLAAARGWTDGRRAFALYILGRLCLASEPELALASFLQADAIFRGDPETRIQSAHVAMQLAAYALSSGNTKAVHAIVGENAPVAAQAENAALLSQLLLIKAEALDYEGRKDEAAAVRQDALGWARYGFGSESEIRLRVAEIASLAPKIRLAAAE